MDHPIDNLCHPAIYIPGGLVGADQVQHRVRDRSLLLIEKGQLSLEWYRETIFARSIALLNDPVQVHLEVRRPSTSQESSEIAIRVNYSSSAKLKHGCKSKVQNLVNHLVVHVYT